MSTTGRIRLLLVTVVALIAAVPATGAAASPPIAASGTSPTHPPRSTVSARSEAT